MIRGVFLLISFVLFVQGTSAQQHSFFQGRSEVKLPFRIMQDFILIELKLEGVVPVNFIFDTGAENTIIFERLYTDILESEYDMRLPIVGSNLQVGKYALVTRNLGIKFQNIPMIEMDVLVLEEYDEKLKEYLGEKIHGILGSTFFKRYIVEIDYRRQHIILHKPNDFNDRNIRRFEQIDIEVKKGKPYINTHISYQASDSIPVNLLMDTGAGINLMVHSNTSQSLKLPQETIAGELGIGVSGALFGYIGRLHSFQFGPFEYKSMITSFQDLDSVLLSELEYHRNGIIGNSLLSRFHLFIDYPHEKVYLKAERGFKEDFKYDRSGLTVIASGPELDQYYIQSVLPGSPADESGLKAGDQILKLQCWPSYFYSLGGINKKFKKKEGKKIRLKVKRNGKKLRFTFRLRKLI
jgi:hypothetical protein